MKALTSGRAQLRRWDLSSSGAGSVGWLYLGQTHTDKVWISVPWPWLQGDVANGVKRYYLCISRRYRGYQELLAQ